MSAFDSVYADAVLVDRPVGYWRLGDPTGYRDAVIADGAVAYWRLDELTGNALDRVGTAHGVVSSGVTRGTPGALADGDAAMTFDGALSNIQATLSAPLAGGVISVEAWAKPATTGADRIFLSAWNGGDFWIGQTSAGAWFGVVYTGGTQHVIVGGVAVVGTWAHVVVTYDGTSLKLYVNGSVTTQAVAGALTWSGQVVGLGNYPSPGYGWPGSLDDVAIYRGVLTPAQVAAHYALRTSTATGNAVDSSGNGHDGVVSGGVTRGATGAIYGDPDHAMTFDGATATAKILVPSAPSIPVPATIELWFKTPSAGAPAYPLFTSAIGPGGDGVVIGAYPGQLQCLVQHNGAVNDYCRPTSTPIDDGQWHHLIWVWPGGTAIECYLDGVALSVTPQLSAPMTAIKVGTWEIGYTAVWGPSLSWNGSIDDVAIYDHALSPGRIAAHFAAGKKPLGKALMYALGKIARGGATRGAYISSDPFITVGGSQVGTTPVAGQRVIMESLAITDTLEQSPNTCAFTVHGFAPTIGSEIVIQLGSKNSLTRLFAGVILSLDEVVLADNPMSPANIAYAVSAIDYTWLLNRRLVVAQYRNQSATAIAIDLVARFSDGFTTTHVVADLPDLDEITFTNASLTDALSQLVKRIGGYYYVDYHRDIHLYVDQESANAVTPPVVLTPAHVSLRHFTGRRDLSQFITRALSEGGGSNALSFVAPGETLIPVEDAIWYDPTGGVVTTGPQRVRYASVRAGGAGSLVGPGARPSSAPTVAAVTGVGLAPGLYQYAMTYGTATGESMPSPIAAVAVSAQGLAPPQSAPKLQGDVGPGPEPGDYTYACTFVTANGETLLSNYSPSISTYDSPARTAQYPPVIRDSGYHNFSMAAGVYQIAYGWIDYAYKYTDRGPAVSFTIGAGPNDNYAQIDGGLAGPQIPGMLGYTVFLTRAGGSELKLMFYSQNTPLTLVVTDAQWLAAPTWTGPTSQQRTVRVYDIPVSPSPDVIARNIYRWKSGGDGLFHKVGTVDGNTNVDENGQTIVFKDTVPNAGVGPAAPSVSTAYSQQVAVSGITTGPASVIRRYVYRSTANGAQLKRLATINDNATTTIPNDVAADNTLGSNVPTSDSSGLNLIGGQINAGSADLLTSSGGVFDLPGGGWAVVGNGQVVVRYHGVNGNTLVGIPVVGPGSITATVNYGSSITLAPTLAGIPAAGDGAIVVAIKQGDAVNLLEQVDDPDAQRSLAVLIGGDGVQESYLSDNRLSATEARARGDALIALRNQVEESIGYTSRDKNTRSGSTARVALPPPLNVFGEFKIQQVTISAFHYPHVFPTFAVQASSNRFSFEDLLRLAQAASSSPT